MERNRSIWVNKSYQTELTLSNQTLGSNIRNNWIDFTFGKMLKAAKIFPVFFFSDKPT